MPAPVKFYNPTTLPKPPGFSHVVEITGPARIVYISGQLGHGLDQRVLGTPGDFRSQCVGAFQNLGRALAEVGASYSDLVKITNYLVDMSHVGIFREVRDSFLNKEAPPASTTVAIAQLARPGAMFEIEAIAVLPPKPASSRTKASAKSTRGMTKKSARPKVSQRKPK
jgi:enamine deaminase RidA (YjgF/YER057c/UK114 family)